MTLSRIGLTALAMLVLSAGAVSAQLKITASPRLPTASDRIEATVSGLVSCTDRPDSPNDEPRIEEGRVILPLASTLCDPPILRPFSETYTFGPLPAGTWVLEALEDDRFSRGKRVLDVAPLTTDLFFHDGEFRVRVDWSTPGGFLHGSAYGVPLSGEAGYFWFFEGKNPEIMIKILDGRPVNGHWWVFISSNTNLEYTVHVGQRGQLNPPTYQEKVYVSPTGANKNFNDTTSFQDN